MRMLERDTSKSIPKRTNEKQIDRRHLFAISFLILLVSIAVIHRNTGQAILDILRCLHPGLNSALLIEKLNNHMDFLGTAVWTMTTILSGFIIMYYETLGYKNFGLPNRKIISFTCGSFFIPGLVAINAAVVGIMTYMYYIHSCADFYVLAIFSCLLQGILIFYCIYPSTYRKAFRTIIDIEEKCFKEYCASKSSELANLLNFVLEGDEPLSEKTEISQRILAIPFYVEYTKEENTLNAIFNYCYTKSNSMLIYIDKNPTKIQQIYDFYYATIQNAVNLFGSELKGNSQLNKENKFVFPSRNEFLYGDRTAAIMYAYFGGIFHVFITEDRHKEKWTFLNYIINYIMDDTGIKEFLIVELLMSVKFLVLTNQIDLALEIDQIASVIKEMKSKIKLADVIRKLFDEQYSTYSVERQIFNDLLKVWVADMTEGDINKYEIIYAIKETFRCRRQDPYFDFLLMCCQEGETNDTAF